MYKEGASEASSLLVIAMDTTFNPDPSDLFYPVVSPSLMKPEWSDLSRFKFNPAFSLGPEEDEYIKEVPGLDTR